MFDVLQVFIGSLMFVVGRTAFGGYYRFERNLFEHVFVQFVPNYSGSYLAVAGNDIQCVPPVPVGPQ